MKHDLRSAWMMARGAKKVINRLSVLCLFILASTSWVAAEDIWFAPPDDLPRGAKLLNDDFSRFWADQNSWATAASHISVFVINPYFASAAQKEKLQEIDAFLKGRHIKLAVGIQSLPVDGCGAGVEGMTRAGGPGIVARRLKQLGIDVAYFALDEPLFFGSTYRGRAACGYSVAEVAHRLAGTIAELHAVYPNAKIVESEPTTDQPVKEWLITLREWLDRYRAETGELPYALVLDSHWDKPWQQANSQSAEILHQQGIKVGMFLDAAGGRNVTDESWMASAQKNANAVLNAKLNLDFIVVASWMMHPSKNLPESDPLSLSALVPWYLKRRSEHH